MAKHTKTITVRALYNDDDVLLDGVKKIKEQGHQIDEVYSPFPIHGLDHALGLKPTRISDAGFIYGILGFSTACLLMYYMMIVDWPMNIGGKPSFSFYENLPAFVPIMFELTVFFAAHLMVWTFWIRNGLYPGKKTANPDPRTTDDHFMIEMSAPAHESTDGLQQLLTDTGALEITEIHEEEPQSEPSESDIETVNP